MINSNELYHHGIKGMKWCVKKAKKSKYNSFFGTSNIEVGKGFVLAFLGTGVANLSMRTLLGNTDLGLMKNFDLAVNAVSGVIGGSIGGLYITNHQDDQ